MHVLFMQDDRDRFIDKMFERMKGARKRALKASRPDDGQAVLPRITVVWLLVEFYEEMKRNPVAD